MVVTIDAQIQDVRVYNGVANTPATLLWVLLPLMFSQILHRVSVVNRPRKITDGAVSFDGSGDYLNIVESNNDFDFDGDFTIETFIYFNDIPTNS